ncbi:hypothetical protein V6N12_062156 [Hibiscus sabdariffa]|uniref:Uncharacterized protein n=1 Tax=Hibiscus sabdariffa TaxID=183260 RepID=A0ABR2F814_9ROSI
MDQRPGKERIILQGSDSVGGNSHVNELASVGGSEVVSLDKVVPVRVSLDPKAHVAVQVVEPGLKMDATIILSRRATMSVGVASVKNNARLQVRKGGDKKGDPVRKKKGGHGTPTVQLGEWIGELEHELDDNGKEKSAITSTGNSLQRKVGANVQWHTNTVFSSKQNQ